MISIEEALLSIKEQSIQTQVVEKDIQSSLGYYLAETILAPFDLPDFDNSAMDGYALCGIDESYQLTGEVAAGDTNDHEMKAGEAVRIFTGGKIPKSTTAVVMQEKTSVSGSQLTIEGTVSEGQNIRLKGSEIQEGSEVFCSGHQITPASIGLIGSLGKTNLKVYKKPTVRLITTGNELIAPGQERKAGQIYESNSLAIIGALNQLGFKCSEKQQISDDYEKISSGIKSYLDKSDVLILSGGISVGDYDFVKEALTENGVQEIFYKVFQKPGKPLYFGRKDHTFVFALPGNPASSLSCFYIYVIPLLQRLSGAIGGGGLTRVSVPLAKDFELKGDRPAFLKASLANNQVKILDGQGSSMIHSMALGNALAFIPQPSKLQSGDLIECILIS